MKVASSRVSGARPNRIPKDLPRYFTLTREEWLYKLGSRRSAPVVRQGAGTALELFERHQKSSRCRVKMPVEALESMTSPAKDTWTVKAGYKETAIKKTRWSNGQLVGGMRPSVPAKRLSLH